jgi:hypothetical protein
VEHHNRPSPQVVVIGLTNEQKLSTVCDEIGKAISPVRSSCRTAAGTIRVRSHYGKEGALTSRSG